MFLGAIGGELSAELPFILMHPKPNMKKILKADTMGHSTVRFILPNTVTDKKNQRKFKLAESMFN